MILPDLVLEDCIFLIIYPLHPGCPVSWHIVVHNIFTQSFIFLCCQLLFFPFHFWFYLFGSSFFFSWWVWLTICHFVYLFKEPALEFIDLLCHSFLRLYFVYYRCSLYYLLPSSHFWLCLLLFILVLLRLKLDCLSELFLIFWDRSVMLWISLIELLSQGPTDFGLWWSHFHLFKVIFWFLPWSCLWPIHCLITCYLASMFLCISQCPSCIWFLVSWHCGKRRCLIWFQSS